MFCQATLDFKRHIFLLYYSLIRIFSLRQYHRFILNRTKYFISRFREKISQSLSVTLIKTLMVSEAFKALILHQKKSFLACIWVVLTILCCCINHLPMSSPVFKKFKESNIFVANKSVEKMLDKSVFFNYISHQKCWQQI